MGRTVSNLPHSLATYTTNALNQYTAAEGFSLSYDANGNLISDGRQMYHYDPQNHLSRVETATARAEFFYDARNRCVLRKYYIRDNQGQWVPNQADSRALTYDAGWNLVVERALGGTSSMRYIHGTYWGAPLMVIAGDKDFYPLADGIGSTVALLDAKSQVVQRYRYSVHGSPFLSDERRRPMSINEAEAGSYRHLFTGAEWLDAFHLSDHRYRTLSPRIGRWLSMDPIGFGGGLNLYEYAKGDAANLVDFVGLAPCSSYSKSRAVTGGGNEGRTSRQNGVPAVNGCTSSPDSFLGIVDFKPACDDHDRCYGTCGSGRAACDAALYSGLVAACEGVYGTWNPTRYECIGVAGIYWDVVRGAGGSYFEAAQDTYCAWEACCP